MELVVGLAIPFLGTTLGSAMVFFMKNKMSQKVEKILLGFASGVMIAASIWSLLIPSIDMAENQGVAPWIPATIGFLVGMLFLLILAGALIGNTGIAMTSAFALAIGIAIQNFPEGAIISMPLKSEGVTKPKAFLYGMLSGIVEPIGAILTILLTNIIVPILPYLLSFAAGAMIYVVVEELIPESQAGEHSNIGTVGVAIGFVIMMILDVALG